QYVVATVWHSAYPAPATSGKAPGDKSFRGLRVSGALPSHRAATLCGARQEGARSAPKVRGGRGLPGTWEGLELIRHNRGVGHAPALLHRVFLPCLRKGGRCLRRLLHTEV